jgi:hypothetical protein
MQELATVPTNSKMVEISVIRIAAVKMVRWIASETMFCVKIGSDL